MREQVQRLELHTYGRKLTLQPEPPEGATTGTALKVCSSGEGVAGGVAPANGLRSLVEVSRHANKHKTALGPLRICGFAYPRSGGDQGYTLCTRSAKFG